VRKAPDYNIISSIEDDIHSDESNESTNEFYNSPECTPYLEKQISSSEFEESDTDTLSLNINTDIHNIVTKHNFDPNEIQVSSLNVNESNRSSFTKAPSTLLGIHSNIPEASINVNRAKKNSGSKKIVKDKKVFCLYCEELVTNFPRHLERKHILELDVRQFILYPKKVMNV